MSESTVRPADSTQLSTHTDDASPAAAVRIGGVVLPSPYV